MSENHSWERRGSRSSHSSRGGPRFPPPPRVSRGWYPPPLRLLRNKYDVINHQKLTLRASCPHQSLPSQSTIPDFLAAIKLSQKVFRNFNYLIGCTWLIVVSTLIGLLVLSPLRCVILVRRAPAVVVIATGLNTILTKKNRLLILKKILVKKINLILSEAGFQVKLGLQ